MSNNKDVNPKIGGGNSFHRWWNNPKNRKKVFDSDKADAADLQKLIEEEQSTANKNKTEQ